MKKTIITISRQYGSGGRKIAEALAKKLEIPLYDNEVISLAAKESGLNEKVFKNPDDVPSSNLLYSISMLGPTKEQYGIPLYEKIFMVQSDAMRALAQKGSCVMLGRCGDYVLKDVEDCTHIFICASLKERVKRAKEDYGLSEENIEKKVLNVDKRRETYYNYHTNQKWGYPSNYHLVINTDHLEINDIIKLIESYMELKK
ncbi:Cytidylate kinase [bioreactor metagenome]|uniref:Cytidylate kinase n=1 Tax=bioreactor metagenome TaxID=1076179 RepID=A0A644ZF22_9ZZZZ|nr:cytidylate kinase-like family protein [Lachnospiraceae bacterium]